MIMVMWRDKWRAGRHNRPCSRGVYAGFSRHYSRVSNKSEFVTRKSEERPQCPHKIHFIIRKEHLLMKAKVAERGGRRKGRNGETVTRRNGEKEGQKCGLKV